MVFLRDKYLPVFFFLVPFLAHGQYYLLNDSSVLRQNKVKEIVVFNCLDSASDCFMDMFDINRNGQVTRYKPGIVTYYEEYEYAGDGKLKTHSVKTKAATDDSIAQAFIYHYNKNRELKYIQSNKYQYGKIVKTDTLASEPSAMRAPLTGIQNKKRQIIEQSLGDLLFPCMIEFKGKHKIRYAYSNGLISSAKVFDDAGKVLIEFVYHYSFY